jgi:hypothetical protein
LLRAALLVIGGAMLVAAAIGALAGCRLAAIIPLAIWGAILAGGVLVERWRYQGLTDDRPGRNWQATPERFVDPETGRPPGHRRRRRAAVWTAPRLGFRCRAEMRSRAEPTP